MEDSKIIELYFDRSEAAIPETEKKYGAYCLSVAKNILGNEEDAKECVNDAYFSLWSSIPPNKPKALSAYLGRIVRNLSLNRYSKNTAEKRGGTETAAVLDEISEFVSGGENTEEKFERKELIGAVNDFLETLSAEKRKIFVLRYWYFESAEETARRFGRNEKYIQNTLHRTRKKLREYLSERGFEL